MAVGKALWREYWLGIVAQWEQKTGKLAADLARAAGVSSQSLSQYGAGNRIPDDRTAMLLDRVLTPILGLPPGSLRMRASDCRQEEIEVVRRRQAETERFVVREPKEGDIGIGSCGDKQKVKVKYIKDEKTGQIKPVCLEAGKCRERICHDFVLYGILMGHN